MNYMSKKVEERFLYPKSDGLKKEKKQRNFFQPCEKELKKKLFHS